MGDREVLEAIAVAVQARQRAFARAHPHWPDLAGWVIASRSVQAAVARALVGPGAVVVAGWRVPQVASGAVRVWGWGLLAAGPDDGVPDGGWRLMGADESPDAAPAAVRARAHAVVQVLERSWCALEAGDEAGFRAAMDESFALMSPQVVMQLLEKMRRGQIPYPGSAQWAEYREKIARTAGV